MEFCAEIASGTQDEFILKKLDKARSEQHDICMSDISEIDKKCLGYGILPAVPFSQTRQAAAIDINKIMLKLIAKGICPKLH
jgi:hypothetical protein